ncbi:restriction endonuclease subunit S [Microbacterium suaedae]|uniref:restriction endonuclease subunit S n=1 Tax=Microbacterium suaedae TaxID=2067813 RepID=UPI000DA1527A|nr:restriction endonuclease subunit S [Microbacterium suaedae]
MSEWREVTLAELGKFSSGKPITPGQRGEFNAYGANGVIGGSDEARYGSGIIVGRVGAYCGAVAVSHEPFWASDNTIVIEPAIDDDLDYLGYLLRSAHLHRYAGGAAQPLVTQGILKALRFRVPEPNVRVRIGRVLADFDDLIENNRRRVEILEEKARSIYREWFVKFRYPGHQDVPIVESALGPIPEGWVVRAVGEVSAVVVRGISPKYAKDGEWIVLNQKCIRNGRVSLAPSRRQERSVSEAKRIRSGDVLINSTGVGTLGRVAMYRGLSEGVTVDSHVTICRPVQGSLNPWYAMSLLAKQSDIERLGAGATGQTELRKSDVEALELVRPAAPVVEAFNAVISPLLEQIDFLLASSETTSALRDLLLPKLVTGQIDISTLDLDALIAAERAGEGAVA